MTKYTRYMSHKLYDIRTIIDTAKNKIRMVFYGVVCGKKFILRGNLLLKNEGSLSIGDGVTINSANWANLAGGLNQTMIQVFPGGVLQIGNNVGISNSAITSALSVIIEDNVLVGSGCRIYDTDFHSIESEYRYGINKSHEQTKNKATLICEGAFIGAGTIILKGSVVGRNSIIGAGSVVRGVIPENEIWSGNPAIFIRKINPMSVC